MFDPSTPRSGAGNSSTADNSSTQNRSTLRDAVENRSVLDSSYGSATPSLETQAQGPQTEGKHGSECGKRIEGTNLFMFKKEIGKDVMDRYMDVQQVIEALLVAHIRASRPNDPKRPPIITRPMVLGVNDEETEEYVGIICPSSLSKKVQSFCDSKHTKELWEPEDPTVPRLKFQVFGQSPRKRLGALGIDVCCDEATAADKTTFCGTPILLVNNSLEQSRHSKRKATFGGVIKVTAEDGNTTLYGMTAGHVLEDWEDDTVEDGYESDQTEVPDGEKISSTRHSVEIKSGSTGDDAWVDAWNFPGNELGKILDNKFSEFAEGRDTPSHDWALIVIRAPKPNQLSVIDLEGHEESRGLLVASRPTFHDGISDPVIMMGGSGGPKKGELSSLPARILIGSNETFVDAYVLELEEDDEVCDGDSGGWVVHTAAPEAYGHLVATDLFGDAYVIPLLDTFNEIKEYMGAASVQLPGSEDFMVTPSEDHDVRFTSISTRQPGDNHPGPTASFGCVPTNNYAARKPCSKMHTDTRDMYFCKERISEKKCDWEPYNIEWGTKFFDRQFKEDGSYVDLKRGLDAEEENDFSLFLRDFEASVPSWKAQEVEEFVQGAHLSDLVSGAGVAGQRRGAWLDDRSSPLCQCVREYENPLTATALYRHLKAKRFDTLHTPDANRRLMCIANLDPYYILALAETASFHQISALRDAIWSHIAFQTSLRVKTPHWGFPIFQLEFHIPYFALRAAPPPKPTTTKVNSRPPRNWTELSFLKIDTPKLQDQKVSGIYEAHISFVICGSHNTRWAGYAFVDTEFDGEEMGEEDFPYEGYYEDPIASDPNVDANLPIWDPREYFLMIVKIRIAQVWKEWEFLVRTVERSIKRYRMQHSSSLSQHLLGSEGGHRAEDVKKTFDWTQQTMELLSKLLDVLSETINAWEIFVSPNGDIGYFYSELGGTSQEKTKLSLMAIKETVETFKGLKDKLVLLDKGCRHSAKALNLRLQLEGNEAVHYAGATTSFIISIISPVALAIAYHSMPQASIPFKLPPKYFVATIMFIMAMVKLLFLVISALPWWWKTVNARIMKMRLDGMGYPGLGFSRRRNLLEGTTDMA